MRDFNEGHGDNTSAYDASRKKTGHRVIRRRRGGARLEAVGAARIERAAGGSSLRIGTLPSMARKRWPGTPPGIEASRPRV